ncbi:OmpA family protein [Flagellimonas sediminis]|uniref:OmpA family protein n=1 Tax=Flagellimonas sediminis TaxID=2696468 RepID=A0A6I5KXZ1_9FLAO|nr:OmpA family protein [Allomuricauda sediminis]NDV44815.1 OmpA family protein [Allomuricauda sediminis]
MSRNLSKLLLLSLCGLAICCSKGKKDGNKDEVTHTPSETETVSKPQNNASDPNPTEDGVLDVNLSDQKQLDIFVNALQADDAVLGLFEEKLRKGGFSEVELLEIKHRLSTSVSDEVSQQTSINNSGDAVKKSAQNLFKTVAKGTDQVMQRGNPNAQRVEDLINERLALINQKTGYNANAMEDLAKAKMADFMGGDKSLLYEKMTQAGVYNAYGLRQAQETIAATNNPDSIAQAMAGYLKMTEREIQLLGKVPSFERYLNELEARENKAAILDPEVEKQLQSGKASQAFTKLLNHHTKIASLNAKSILNKSKKARAQFQKLNPTWNGEDDAVGNTYFDEKGNVVFLPLGKISFADRVVSHKPGFPKGGFSEGSLGEPDLPKDTGNFDARFCSIGIGGVLVLEFTDNALTDVNGPDLFIFEIGKVEPTVLEISKDGNEWIHVGEIEGGTAMVDIHEFVKPGETFTFVRLTDLMTESGIPGADVDAVAAIGGAIRLQLDSSVLFEFGKFELKPEAEVLLSELIPQIEQLGKGTIVVEGHTDNIGNAVSNKTLSEQRAQSVSQVLKSLMKGSANNFSWQTKGFGDSQPVAPNNTDENRQKNRRVELLILPK